MSRQAWRDDAAWNRWLSGLGETLRAARETIGISQERLARAAGVSQASLSRVEMGRGLGTPLVLVVRVVATLRAMVGLCDRSLLSPEAIALLSSSEGVPPPAGVPSPPLAADERLAGLVGAFQELGPAGRAAVLTLARALAEDVRPPAETPAECTVAAGALAPPPGL
jgi:transcriptional regulator with XRE-family HTH domain